jgi:DNA polymerase-3 subunit epsilon
MKSKAELENFAAQLEASGEYRVLRRLHPRIEFSPGDKSPKKMGIILDTETTGLDYLRDEIIELAMVKFEFASDGRIFKVIDTFNQVREPTIPISQEVSALTGITADMVSGRTIDLQAVESFVEDAVIVIAHNADFDRKFCEQVWTCFAVKAWACSMKEIDWRAEGFEGYRLGYLLAGIGYFHDGHRAVEDCKALIELLSSSLPVSAELALRLLLDNARKSTARVWAQNSPFDLKDCLKSRGYRWNDGADARPRAWWIDVPEEQLMEEQKFLRDKIYGGEFDFFYTRLTAFNRYSTRINIAPSRKG